MESGSVIGGILISIWGGFKNRIHTVAIACTITAIVIIGIGLSKVFIIYLILIGLTGFTMPFFNAPTTVYFQENVSTELQGRVFGFLNIITNTAMPISIVIFGPIADIISIESILIVTGMAGMFISVHMYFNKMFRQENSNS